MTLNRYSSHSTTALQHCSSASLLLFSSTKIREQGPTNEAALDHNLNTSKTHLALDSYFWRSVFTETKKIAIPINCRRSLFSVSVGHDFDFSIGISWQISIGISWPETDFLLDGAAEQWAAIGRTVVTFPPFRVKIHSACFVLGRRIFWPLLKCFASVSMAELAIWQGRLSVALSDLGLNPAVSKQVRQLSA